VLIGPFRNRRSHSTATRLSSLGLVVRLRVQFDPSSSARPVA